MHIKQKYKLQFKEHVISLVQQMRISKAHKAEQYLSTHKILNVLDSSY